MANFEHFERIVRALARHPEGNAYSCNQIAFLAFDKGNSANAAKVGRAAHAFAKYFQQVGFGRGRKYSLLFDVVRQDHPRLLNRSCGVVRGPAAGPKRVDREQAYEEMIDALGDERKEVINRLREAPIRVTSALRDKRMEMTGDVVFRLEYHSERDDDAFPIPDGAPLRVRRGFGETLCYGTLLSHDGDQREVFVLLDRLVELGGGKVYIEPKLDELVEAVRTGVRRAEAAGGGVHDKLVCGTLRPARVERVPVPSEHLDPAQLRAVRTACSRDVCLMWGPPGTGKTYTLGEAIAAWVRAERRVLVVSVANVAVDQVALSVRDALERHGELKRLDRGRILRFGNARDLKVFTDRRFFPDKVAAQEIRASLRDLLLRQKKAGSSLSPDDSAKLQLAITKQREALRDITKHHIAQASVVLSTVVQTCVASVFQEQEPFDVVVVDEASMMSLPHLVAAGSLSKAQILIAGDFRQLGPIAVAQTDLARRWLLRDVFSLAGVSSQEVPRHPALAMLKAQRRMHPGISALVNGPFYGGLLKDNAPAEKTAAFELPPRAGDAAVLLDCSPEGACQVEQTKGGSRVNRGTAKRAALLAAWYREHHPDVQVAVITPYRAQARLIREHLGDAAQARRNLEGVVVGTVHTFQGSERDIVIWDLVDNRAHRIGRLFRGGSGDRLTNVAVTRARGKLIVLADPLTFVQAKGYETVGKARLVIQALRRHLVSWRDVSALLVGRQTEREGLAAGLPRRRFMRGRR